MLGKPNGQSRMDDAEAHEPLGNQEWTMQRHMNQMDNQEWTMQRHMNHCAQDTECRQINKKDRTQNTK
jgi:hypothetical protein